MADLYDMSDEELEAAFKEAKAAEDSPETAIEEEAAETEEEVVEEVEEDVEPEDGDTEEDEINDDLEQPDEDEDSDSDDSDEDEAEEEDDEESEEDEGELDEEPKTDEEQPEESEDKAKDESQPVQKHKFRANGKDYEFTMEEMAAQFPKAFGQAMDYTKKMQALKPWRKSIDAMEQADLTHDDVNLMIDVLKGDKDAITEIIKRTGVDALDLDTENTTYKPNDYGRDETTLAINEVVDKISADKEYEVTQRVLSKEWDVDSWNEMSKDPSLIEALHIDVKSGVYNKVQAMADMIKLQDNGKHSDLEYYKEAGRHYYAQQRQESEAQAAAEKRTAEQQIEKEKQDRLAAVKAQDAKRKATTKVAKKRKAAAPTAKGAGTKKVTDYLDDSEEAYEDWYKKLQEAH